MNCQLTVLMTVYNGAPYLRTAIDSVLKQTYRDFRFLIVDDGSTDASSDIVRSYDDKRIELLCLDRNIGQTAALNVGLQRISTPWIARMDADDYSATTRLEKQMRVLDADKSIGCLGTFAWEFRDDPRVVEAIQKKPLQHADIMRALLRGSPIIHGSLVVRRSALLDVGGYNERYRYSADLELYDRLLPRYRSANIGRPLLGLRRHHNQGSCSRIAIEEGIEIFSRRLSSNGYSPVDIATIRASLSVSYLQRARQLIVEQKYFDVWKDLLSALRASPKTFLWHSFTVPVNYLLSEPMCNTIKRLYQKLFGSIHPMPSSESANGTHQKGEYGSRELTTPVSWERLTEALYSLRRKCPLLPVLAIPWIHPKHPIHTVQEELMRGQRASKSNGADMGGIKRSVLWQAGRNMLNSARYSLVLLHLRWHLRREIAVLKRRDFDLVAKTWSFGSAHSTSDQDFYYGDLQRRLNNSGVRMLLLCGDAKGTDWKAFSRAHVNTSGLCKLPEACLLHPLAPLWMALEQVGASLILHISKLYENDSLMRRVFSLASSECLSSFVNYCALYFYIGRRAVQLWHPRAFMTLYEGHGWEKCAWWGVKSAEAACKTVGYQHTVVHNYNLSLLRPNGDQHEPSTPDIVLCLGERTKQMMQPGHVQRDSQLITFGSFRRNPDNTRHALPEPGKRTVLVLPEGLANEARVLFNFVLLVARFVPDHLFIFRCHPVLPFPQVRPLLDGVPEELPNIEISDRDSISEDFARSSVVLYRGSSSVLVAVLHGLKPIYLQDACQRDVDPLFELSSWRESVSSAREMEQILLRYAASAKGCALQQWRSAVEYVSSYAAPVDAASIDRFLAALRLPAGMSER